MVVRVSLNIEMKSASADDLSDVADLLDIDYMDSCRERAASAPSLEEVRRMLSGFSGSLAERITAERDER